MPDTPGVAATSNAFATSFILLGVLHALLFVATLRLPWLIDNTVAGRSRVIADTSA